MQKVSTMVEPGAVRIKNTSENNEKCISALLPMQAEPGQAWHVQNSKEEVR